MLKLDYTDVIVITIYNGTWCMEYKVYIALIIIDVGVPWNVNKYHKDNMKKYVDFNMIKHTLDEI